MKRRRVNLGYERGAHASMAARAHFDLQAEYRRFRRSIQAGDCSGALTNYTHIVSLAARVSAHRDAGKDYAHPMSSMRASSVAKRQLAAVCMRK
jgi:hypothetical protein